MAGKAIAVTDGDFEATILKASKPALVDFWAVWCGPCRNVAPMVEELAEEYSGRAIVAKLDVDSNREVAVQFGIQAIPTLLFIKDGKIADRVVGMADKKSLQAKLDALL